MNFMEGRTRIEGLIDKRDEILNDAATIVAKTIASKSEKGSIEQDDIDKLLKDFTPDEKYIIMCKVVCILAKNSNLRVDDYSKKNKKSNIFDNGDGASTIFANRGYR